MVHGGDDAASLCSSSTRSSGTRCSFGPLQSMAARDELRRRRREELRARYENTKRQKEMELKARVQREAELEKLQRKAYVEQKKLAEKQRLEKEEEKKKQRELWCQQFELAALHCSRKKLVYYGMLPWKRLIWNERTKMDKAWTHCSLVLERKIFAAWWSCVSDRMNEAAETIGKFRGRWCQVLCLRLWLKTLKMTKFYCSHLVKRCLYSFKEAVETRGFYEETSAICNHIRLCKWIWNKWKVASKTSKDELFLKEQIAIGRAKRARCMRCMNAWKYAISDELSEKKKQESRAATWAKINTWLEEYHRERIAKLEEETTPPERGSLEQTIGSS
ncbi:coiled-coil domain-containing protein 191-like [Selaginella moellendorffii]|uniref:coiled-coil domain-containing protein 191-like n=1 Tax=Selaginella moellendorffii TaxID=88036 RepID=UPI000D1D0DB6|nr:coiled-coil domain-containing protein 191-like [Selaginella moellendorffii]|eukprot:XP_024524465.1 coiled-coil domain-containing protein 191-like [Selaginella moellendorffii]